MGIIFETDLISRKIGNSVECIYSGSDCEKANEIAENFNRNLPDYDVELGFSEYYDGKSDGLYADVWICETEGQVQGVGKF